MGMRLLKPTWTRGELTPLAHARPDVELYQQGAETIENWFVLKEGGLRRRSATRYRGAARSSTSDIRLVDFRFSAAQTYAVEFSPGYCRFWTKDGQVEDGGNPYEIVSPYTEGDLCGLNWEQSGDVLYIAAQSTKPQKLRRSDHTDWSFADVAFKDGPYLPINDAATNTCTTSAAPVTSSTSTLSFATLENINNGAGFQVTDVGRQLRAQFDGKWSWGVITAVNDTDEVVVTWSDGQGGTTASLSWRLGMFSDTTGYPKAVAIFQGRVIWAGTPLNPRSYGYSYSGLPDTFSPSAVDGTVTDAHGGAGDITVGDDIQWLMEAPRLQIGTPSAIRSLGAQDLDQEFSPRNVFQKLEVREGVSSVRPVAVGPSTVHCGQYGTTISELYYDYQVNALVNPELSVTAEHLVSPGVTELCFQSAPHRRLFAIADGDLIATTINRYEKIIGWTSQDVGGEVVTMTSIGGTNQNDLWMVVRRTINGAQVQYVETLDPDFLRGSLEDAFFSDCGGTYDGVATNSITGIAWLPNTPVSILADGKVLPNATVSAAGVLTLPNGVEASKVQFGLPMTARMKTLRAPLQLGNGTSLGRRMKVHSADVDVFETRGLKIKSDVAQIDTLKERPADRSAPVGGLTTGEYHVKVDGSWQSKGQIEFVADYPLPATIRAVVIYAEAED